jgi:prepilin-type N-terminal cleavage/methylation domain-containing protein
MRDNKGFTLIELLIVVVIIGILAAIAIPKFSQTREKAFVSAMKSDLKNMASQQEIYYADNYEYANTLALLEATLSEGVTLGSISASSTGWSAVLNHSGTTQVCDVYYGDATATANALGPGAIGCSAPAP